MLKRKDPGSLDILDLDRHLADALEIVGNHIRQIANDPVVPRIRHEELYDLIAHELPWEGLSPEIVIKDVKETVLPHCTRIGHPRFLAWIVTSPAPAGTIGEILNIGLNQVPLSYKGGPAATVLEEIVINWFNRLFGYPETAGGVLVSGGTAANLTALAVARELHAPSAMRRGLQNIAKPLVMYVSEQGHMSVERSAGMLGIGAEWVKNIPVDDHFRIVVKRLREQIESDRRAGCRPFCVVAQAGSVNTGAIDPMPELADICAENGLWLHVDAAYGGGAILTHDGTAMLKGIDRADSIATDPHKWFFTPVEAGCTLIKNRENLFNTYRCKAAYLGEESSLDYMNYTFQLTRASRALKIWFAFRVYGLNRISAIVKSNIALAREFQEKLERRQDWQLLAPVELSIVCFRYLPGPDWREPELNRLQTRILSRLESGGEAFLTPAVLNGRIAIRICFANHRTTSEDSDLLLRRLTEIGKECSQSL